MKTWQMVKELTENPGKRFKSDDYEAYIDDGLLEVTFVANRTDFSIFIDREWEEVKTPVTFMEAFEALRDYEKNIHCILNGKKHSYNEKAIGIFKFREDCIAEGKWYIED